MRMRMRSLKAAPDRDPRNQQRQFHDGVEPVGVRGSWLPHANDIDDQQHSGVARSQQRKIAGDMAAPAGQKKSRAGHREKPADGLRQPEVRFLTRYRLKRITGDQRPETGEKVVGALTLGEQGAGPPPRRVTRDGAKIAGNGEARVQASAPTATAASWFTRVSATRVSFSFISDASRKVSSSTRQTSW